MNSLTDLREVVDVVIGVDTHVHTHSAAVVDTATGGVLDEITVEATAEGYAELVEFANSHADVAGLGDRGDRRSRCWLEPVSAGALGDRHRVGPSEADCTPQRREVRPTGCDPRRPRGDGATAVGNSPQWWRTPSTVGAVGCSSLRDQCLHRGPAAGLQPGDRGTRTHPSPVPRPEARRDAQHRREAAGSLRRGTSRRPAPSWPCVPWHVARTRC